MNSITILGWIHRKPVPMNNGKGIACWGIVGSKTRKKEKDTEGRLYYLKNFFLFEAYGRTAEYLLKNYDDEDPILIIGEIIPSKKNKYGVILIVRDAKGIDVNKNISLKDELRSNVITHQAEEEEEDYGDIPF